MFDNQIPMMAQIPSGSAMPTSAPMTAAPRGTGLLSTGLLSTGLGAGAGMTIAAVCAAPTYVVRDRYVAGDAIAKPFPGPTAWSPPPS